MAIIRRLIPSIPTPEAAQEPSAEEIAQPTVTPVSLAAPAAEVVAATSAATTPGRTKSAKNKDRDLYQDVTNMVMVAIENGTAPWQQPWDGRARWPVNGVTGVPYHGINVMLLAAAGYQDARWCSYKIGQKNGWQVRRDEEGTKIYFYKPFQRKTGEIDPETQEPEVVTIPILKNHTIFNLSQMDGAPELEHTNSHVCELDDLTEQKCLEIIDATGADIVYGQRRAAYSPSLDRIFMPDKESFESDAHFFSTLLHELSHWSGHESRMNRQFGPARDSDQYAKEELRAEMASAMIAMRLNLPGQIEGHAAYVDSYLKVLRDDKKEIFRAAKDAERMARYVLSHHPDFKDEFEAEHQVQMAAHAEAGAPEEIFDATDFDFESEELSAHPSP
jgi:antirestriction protein ArdC